MFTVILSVEETEINSQLSINYYLCAAFYEKKQKYV